MSGQAFENSFDIIGITELYSMSKGECSLDGYHALDFKTRDETTRSRGGVGMYVREDLNYVIRDDLSVFIPNIFESIFAEIYINHKTIIVGTIYRPNTLPKADLDIFMDTMNR